MRSWIVAGETVVWMGRMLPLAIRAIVWPLIVPVTGLAELAAWIQSSRHLSEQPSRLMSAPPATDNKRPEALTYVISSFFLRECLRTLTPGKNEELYAVSGVRIGDTCIPHLLRPLEYEYSSPVGCAAKLSSSHARLRELADHGHVLQMMVHSHPGTGRRAVCESSIDIATQEQFERSGYQAITGIFTRDGFVRFFSISLPFHVRVYGNSVTEVEHNVFYIESELSHIQV